MIDRPDLPIEGMTFVVSGAGGYIGCRLTDELLRRGAKVRAFDRYFFGVANLVDANNAFADQLTIIKRDIRDAVPEDFEGADAVLDLAALSNDPSGDLEPELTWSINLEGRCHFARMAKAAGVPRYVMSSTCSIYGAADRGLSTEETAANPVSIYAKSNYQAETEILALTDGSFTACALRNATVFGLSRRMRFDLVVNLMTLSAFEKGQITIMGGGKQWRPLVHVSDVAEGLIRLAIAERDTISAKIFNIGVGNYQVQTIAAIVREVLPFQIQLQFAPDDPDRRNYRVDFSRLANEVGFEPRIGIEEGVREVYNALKMGETENGLHCSTVG
ncbi:MAG: SDR family oxidoreductase, partial [Pseudomonadota bacterium]